MAPLYFYRSFFFIALVPSHPAPPTPTRSPDMPQKCSSLALAPYCKSGGKKRPKKWSRTKGQPVSGQEQEQRGVQDQEQASELQRTHPSPCQDVSDSENQNSVATTVLNEIKETFFLHGH